MRNLRGGATSQGLVASKLQRTVDAQNKRSDLDGASGVLHKDVACTAVVREYACADLMPASSMTKLSLTTAAQGLMTDQSPGWKKSSQRCCRSQKSKSSIVMHKGELVNLKRHGHWEAEGRTKVAARVRPSAGTHAP